jgi:opacity protein-like surface antigen
VQHVDVLKLPGIIGDSNVREGQAEANRRAANPTAICAREPGGAETPSDRTLTIMRTSAAAAVTILALLVSRASWAQSPPLFIPELSVGVGLGHVFRFEDQTFGDRLNLGVSVAMVHRSRFAFELEASKTRELSPIPAPCGIVGITCVGVGHDGPRSVMSMSANLQYRFRNRRLQPYVSAGLGVMRSRSLHSTTRVTGSQGMVTEEESRNTGFGPDLGAGVRIPISRSLSINPEIRWLEAAFMSRENLAVTRLTLRVAYSFSQWSRVQCSRPSLVSRRCRQLSGWPS